MNRLPDRLYRLWLIFIRYANAIDLHAATLSGNDAEKMWCRNRISQLDQQLDNLRISTL
jgi:hypothetical protein